MVETREKSVSLPKFRVNGANNEGSDAAILLIIDSVAFRFLPVVDETISTSYGF